MLGVSPRAMRRAIVSRLIGPAAGATGGRRLAESGLPGPTTAEDEAIRLEAVQRLRIVDTASEPAFDRLVAIVADLFGAESVGIHLLDDERQWVKAFHGEQFGCARGNSICQFTIAQRSVLNISDARADPRLRELASVAQAGGIRFYAGAPLFTRDGSAVGTLCLLDSEPRPPLDEQHQRWLVTFAQLVIETMELRVDYHHSQQRLQHAAEVDPITGLLNRATLLRNTVQLLQETRPPVGLVALNIRLDRMTVISRARGDAGRVAVLREATKRLQELVSGAGEGLSRGKDDNFVITAVRRERGDSTLAAWAEERAARVRERLAQPFIVDGESVRLTATVGAAGFDDEVAPYYAVDAADAAALAGQEAGGNCVNWFTSQVVTAFQDLLSLENALREAVDQGAFALVYQPIVDITRGERVIGAEALVRWPRGDQPMIGPDRFIPLAEEIGLIEGIGLWVFDRACADLADWRSRGWDMWVSVNVSPVQLRNTALPDELARRAHAAGVDPHAIKLEITESALASDFAEVQSMLHRLHEAGFKLALDDFGTGHSSLARVIRLPFDTLKVDRGFVADCPDGAGAAVAASLADLAGTLRMEAIAEGVDNDAHVTFLRDHNYTLAQGYRYARPTPARAIEALLPARASPTS